MDFDERRMIDLYNLERLNERIKKIELQGGLSRNGEKFYAIEGIVYKEDKCLNNKLSIITQVRGLNKNINHVVSYKCISQHCPGYLFSHKLFLC